MSILSGTIGSSIKVDSAHVTQLLRSSGKAMLGISEACVSLPVNYDLESELLTIVEIKSPISGNLEWAVKNGQMVETGDLVASVGDTLITADRDGWVNQSKTDKCSKDEQIGHIRTTTSLFSTHTIRELRAFQKYWNTSESSDLMELRELAVSRRDSLFGISRGATVWQGLLASPKLGVSAILSAESDNWSKLVAFIPKAANSVEAANVAKAILAGEPSKADEEPKKDESDKSGDEGKQDETPKSDDEGKQDETPKSDDEGKQAETPKTEEEVRREEAVNRAKSVKSLSDQIMTLCVDLTKLVGNVQDAPQGDLWGNEDILSIQTEMDQSVRVVAITALARSISLDA
jgi:hypothetical protein